MVYAGPVLSDSAPGTSSCRLRPTAGGDRAQARAQCHQHDHARPPRHAKCTIGTDDHGTSHDGAHTADRDIHAHTRC